MMTFSSPFPSAPTVLLVGFLGAGKTTFLRNLLPLLQAAGLEPFVVLNDYRNAGIDAGSLRSLVKEVTAINGNCVCCDSIHELIDALLAMPPRPNRVVLIEANGTTDPFSLIEHLTAHAELRGKFFPLLQVGVIDGKRWQKRRWHNELESLQAQSASHLVYTRREEVGEERFSRVRSDLEWINPRAVETSPEKFAAELAVLALQPPAVTFSPVSARQKPSLLRECVPHHRSHHLAHAFVAIQMDLPPLVTGALFYEWLRQIPANVLRIKGIVQMEELPDLHFIFQRADDAGKQPTMFPLTAKPVMPPCVVLIGVRLDEAALRRQMETLLGPPEGAAG